MRVAYCRSGEYTRARLMGSCVTRLRTVPCTEEGGSAAPKVDCAFARKQGAALERRIPKANMPRRDLRFADASECLAGALMAGGSFIADYYMSKPIFLEGLVAVQAECAASVGFRIR